MCAFATINIICFVHEFAFSAISLPPRVRKMLALLCIFHLRDVCDVVARARCGTTSCDLIVGRLLVVFRWFGLVHCFRSRRGG